MNQPPLPFLSSKNLFHFGDAILYVRNNDSWIAYEQFGLKHGPAIYYQGIMKIRSWMFQMMINFDMDYDF